jgi:hypothetical protein
MEEMKSDSSIDLLIVFATHWLIPLMTFLFFSAIIFRFIIYYTIKREEWFSKEFLKRVDNFLEERDPNSNKNISFYVITKRLLEKTYYELFKVRLLMKRRKPDFIMTVSDRIFLINQGAAFLVKDMLKSIMHIKYNDSNHPKLKTLTKKNFAHNPSFSKIFGIVPASALNDIINILPGIFIVMGVLGTFLGIMKALPDLGAMDLNDIDATKSVMDLFLVKISFSMSTSLVGIILSVIMSFINAGMSPEKVFITAVDKMESGLDSLWHLSTNNLIVFNEEFDENRNPEEVLAEQALTEALILGKNKRRTGSKKPIKVS